MLRYLKGEGFTIQFCLLSNFHNFYNAMTKVQQYQLNSGKEYRRSACDANPGPQDGRLWSLTVNKVFFGPIPASFLFIFVLFSLHFQNKLKKAQMVCLDQNPGLQDGRHRRNHRAIAATQLTKLTEPKNDSRSCKTEQTMKEKLFQCQHTSTSFIFCQHQFITLLSETFLRMTPV